jgi:uncharacterized membrane protein
MPSKLLAKIDLLNRKLNKVEKIEEHLDKLVGKEERDVKKIEVEEKKIEKAVVRVGNINIKRSHLMELARGTAGAFLGVGLGQALANSVTLAGKLPWINILGILFFVLVLVGLLIYKNDKDQAKNHPEGVFVYIFQKLVTLYAISLVVQLLGLILFNNFPGWNEILLKALIIGSYAAMSSAAAFTLI